MSILVHSFEDYLISNPDPVIFHQILENPRECEPTLILSYLKELVLYGNVSYGVA